MDRWTPLAPSKPGTKTAQGSVFSTARLTSVLKPTLAYGGPSPSPATRASSGPFAGRLPESAFLRVLQFLPVSDFPSVARASRAFARLAKDERAWQGRCQFLGLNDGKSAGVNQNHKAEESHVPAVLSASVQDEDDFGDFSSQSMSTLENTFEDIEFDDQPVPESKEKSLMDFHDMPLPSRALPTGNAKPSGFFAFSPPRAQTGSGNLSQKPSSMNHSVSSASYEKYKSHHLSLVPLCKHLRSSASPSATLAMLFPPSPHPPSIQTQSKLLLSLIRFLSPAVQPLRDWGFLRQALLAAVDRFDSACLVAFETADSRKDEEGMKEASLASWAVWNGGGGRRDEWECGRVWVEKREILYEGAKWDPLANIVKAQTPTGGTIRQLDFTPMDSFMSHIIATLHADGRLGSRVFPDEAYVLLAFCERLATDIISEYIQPLLSQARVVSNELYLRATAASFVQAWRLVDAACDIKASEDDKSSAVPRKLLEDVIYRMFEVHMDEYLDEETDAIKAALDSICQEWDSSLGVKSSKRTSRAGETPTFLNAANPDQVKRNVLAGFRDVLLLPVTIVPRTVTFGVNAIVTGGAQAVNGLAMLNPQRWTSQGSGAARITSEPGKPDGQVLFDVPALVEEKTAGSEKDGIHLPSGEDPLNEQRASLVVPSSTVTPRSTTPVGQNSKAFDRLQLLVSLDTALELIHADRESLKRAETFAGYPGKYGVKVREAIEEIFILLLQATSDRHIAPGFQIATNQMGTYKPAEHEETTSVAPLLQFFELVHIGDTIQSMVQVYFDKEMIPYVDRTDFLNSVMREKKRFESILDDAVASGLNAGIEVLMNQVEHIIQVKTGPREYYPVEGVTMELGPTKGCQEAIACLETHCSLLKGSTSKDVLEVFYQEVGIRLQAILQRHLKRQIISLEGGFQIIADLNAYYAFVASLKQQRITEDFSNLKLLGHVYIVSDAKDLAQIVRDVTRYGGTFRPEDIYEFIQRRSDWKKIEKTVDKAMYALSVKEDCLVM